MSQNQPIAFEIEIKNLNASPMPPAIKKKLEELSCHAAAPPQLEDIEKKLLKAKKRRLDRHANTTNIDDRVRDVNERKSNLIREFTAKTLKAGETKRETAEQLRVKAINLVLEKARKQTEKVISAQDKQDKLNEDAKKLGEKIDTKLMTAKELRQKIIDEVLEKAKKTSEKVINAHESRTLVVKKKGEKIENKLQTAEQLRSNALNKKVEAARKVIQKIDKANETRQKSQQQRERSLQDNLDKVSQGSQKSQAYLQNTVLKAKAHFEKVQKVSAEQKEKQAKQATTKHQEILFKQQKADAKKEQLLQDIKDKAKKSTIMRGSKSVDKTEAEQ